MIVGVRSLIARAGLVELVLAFALALTIGDFLSAVVNGLITTPIEEGDSRGYGALTASIGGRTFTFMEVLSAGFELAIVAALCIWFSRHAGDRLWENEPATECPHCLSEISSAASVCAYCTRDVH